jgi:hypothetical protein
MPDDTCPECGYPTGPDGWCPECGGGLAEGYDAYDDQGGDPDPGATEAERREEE